jgi:hypothetical protein
MLFPSGVFIGQPSAASHSQRGSMTTGEGEEEGERTRDGVPLLWATALILIVNAAHAINV